VALFLVFLVLLAVPPGWLMLRHDAAVARIAFQREARFMHNALAERVGESAGALGAVAGFFEAGRSPGPAPFRELARRLMQRFPGIEGIGFTRIANGRMHTRYAAGRPGAPPLSGAALRQARDASRDAYVAAAPGEGGYFLVRSARRPGDAPGADTAGSAAIVWLHLAPARFLANAGVYRAGTGVRLSAGGRTLYRRGPPPRPARAWLPLFRAERSVPVGGQTLELSMWHPMSVADLGLVALLSLVVASALAALFLTLLLRAGRLRQRERRQAEARLVAERERAQVTLSSIGDGVVSTDVSGRVDYLNPVAERLTGRHLDDALGRPASEVVRLFGEDGDKPLEDPLGACLAEGRPVSLEDEVTMAGPDDTVFAVNGSVAPIRDRDGATTGAVMVFHDVSRERRMASQIEYQAKHDPLTGLINRAELEAQLTHAVHTARFHHREHALCHLDIDQFNLINETCGHAGGDELLRQIGQLLRSRVRGNDVLARLGGDEFAVLLFNCSLQEAEKVGGTLREIAAQFRFVWERMTFELSVSVGVVPVQARSGTVSDILAAADSACYMAKEQGRNRVHVYQPDEIAIAHRHGEMQWLHRVYEALEEERFVLYAQRIQPLRHGSELPPGRELLLRMIDENGRVLPPSAFVPGAERYGLMESIDRWAVRAALTRLARSPDAHEGFFSLNVSGQALAAEGFVDYVESELRRSGANAARLCFEISETAALTNPAATTAFIHRIRERGCRVALDDFGSGASSFLYLKNLPVDVLKIDAKLVQGMTGNPVDAAMVESLNRIAGLMGLETVAQGADSPATVQRLRILGVDYAQGAAVQPAELFVKGRARIGSMPGSP